MQQQAAAAAEQAKELVGDFRDQLDAATDAISQWEAHCSELNEQLEERTDSYYEDQIESQLQKITELEQANEASYVELSNANKTISQEQLTRVELETRVAQLGQGLSNEQILKNQLEEKLKLEKSSTQKLETALEKVKEDHEQLNVVLKEERHNMEENCQDFEQRAMHAEEEVSHLQETIERLEDQLRASQEKIQSLLTDEVSLKVRFERVLFYLSRTFSLNNLAPLLY